jgi:hypothetical protein
MGDPPRFARKFRSDEGARGGPYWPTAEDEEPSPLGDLIAAAASEGYLQQPDGGDAAGNGEPAGDGSDAGEDGVSQAYHGYRYRILTAQGENAAPGEMSYLDAEGRMTRGFAAVAWPASYGNSGVMTFLVNARGIVFEKDLGPDTATAVQAITAYDPDDSWSPTGD